MAGVARRGEAKKLEGAARYWLGGADDGQGARDDLAAFGIQDAEIAPQEDYLIWPENWPVLEAFLAAATQWRMAPMGGVLGLDYVAMETALRALRIDLTPELFDGVRVIEAAVISTLHARSRR